jgi:hypothetical protein
LSVLGKGARLGRKKACVCVATRRVVNNNNTLFIFSDCWAFLKKGERQKKRLDK